MPSLSFNQWVVETNKISVCFIQGATNSPWTEHSSESSSNNDISGMLLFCPLPEEMKMMLAFSTGRNLPIRTYFWTYFVRMCFAAWTASQWSESLFTESRFCTSLAVPSTKFWRSLLTLMHTNKFSKIKYYYRNK